MKRRLPPSPWLLSDMSQAKELPFLRYPGFSLLLLGLKVFPIVVIGGLDSIPGSIVGAVAIGVLESLTAGYVDPLLGAGFSSVAPYVLLLGVLFVRPHGIFGRPEARRV